MKRIPWCAIDDTQRAGMLRRPTQQAAATVTASVAELINEVVVRGDAAVRELTQRLARSAPQGTTEGSLFVPLSSIK